MLPDSLDPLAGCFYLKDFHSRKNNIIVFILLNRGTEEFHGILGRVDIINSTLGKALGGASGGYTTGPRELIDMLRQKSRPYLFSNSLPPAVVGTGIKVKNFTILIDPIIFNFSTGNGHADRR